MKFLFFYPQKCAGAVTDRVQHAIRYKKQIAFERFYSRKQSLNTTKKARNSGFFCLVEARGVEPLSENLFTRLSTSVVDILTFPLPHSYRQDYGFSRLLIPPGSSQARVGSPH